MGGVEIRWVEPLSGVSREQYDVVAGAWREDFSQLQGPMLRLGAITGLFADIFASLDDGGYGTGGSEAPQRLTVLLEEYGYPNARWGTCRPTRTWERYSKTWNGRPTVTGSNQGRYARGPEQVTAPNGVSPAFGDSDRRLP